MVATRKWLVGGDASGNTVAFVRWATDGSCVVAISNFSPVPHEQYSLPMPNVGMWHEILNTDAIEFGGSGVTNSVIEARAQERDGFVATATLRVPPLATIWLSL